MSLAILGLVIIGAIISFFWLKKINRNVNRNMDGSIPSATNTKTKTKAKPKPPCKRNPDEDNEF